jgi:WD repeat-containing protein mio
VTIGTAKASTRSLESFAIVPNQNARFLVSQVMVTTKDGDVEVLDVYDTPKQAVWSARGDVTIGGGLDCRVIHIEDPSAERWETSRSPALNPHSTSKDVNTEPKGLGGDFTPPLFGRGDEDGFPALFHPSILVTQRNSGTDELATSKSHKMANRVRQKLHHSRSLKGAEHIIHDDVSMIMKRRALRGYGIGDVSSVHYQLVTPTLLLTACT